MLRLSASPHAIAAGFAAGVMVSFTPFVGLHFVLAAILAFVTGGNILASALGTALGNPLTFPFIWAASYRMGLLIMGGNGASHPPIDMSLGLFAHSWDTLMPVLTTMLIGAVPLGIIAWIVFYFLVRTIVRSFQAARQRRFEEHAARKDAVAPTSLGSEG
ncbi:DUF2062 domain-containing protein [Microbaculum sp. A6E488]|uniref:DUF2062 domain-containing protein n=1 Tax=Microbaculum marinisediminis TaxID=2931392 RepID=A0AAW5R325_9HYPH|nr:DUF2062 domain-containing protein [Microbaculum sp. A6E488]